MTWGGGNLQQNRPIAGEAGQSFLEQRDCDIRLPSAGGDYPNRHEFGELAVYTDADACNDFVAIIPSNRHRTHLHFEENCAILRIGDDVRLDYTPSLALTGSLVTTALHLATAHSPRFGCGRPSPRTTPIHGPEAGWKQAESTGTRPGGGLMNSRYTTSQAFIPMTTPF